MPLLRRLFLGLSWLPLLGGAGAAWSVLRFGGGWAPAAAAAVLVPALYSGVFLLLRRTYQSWSQAPAPPPATLVPPEPALWWSAGGFLTPGCAAATAEKLVLYVGGKPAVSLAWDRVQAVQAVRGRWLGTPYLDLLGDGERRIARLAVESAAGWADVLGPVVRRPGPVVGR